LARTVALVAAAVFVTVLVWRTPAVRSAVVSRSKAQTLGQRIVAVAESQLGYHTDPAHSYCNKYSAFWQSGSADCPNGLLSEEWCADFAAWVWWKAGAEVAYQYEKGDLNGAAVSFYEWGVDHGTWHPVGSGYVPQPGDVAVYGLDAAASVAAHVAVVTGYDPGERGPNVINGDGDRTGFSVVETGTDQYQIHDAPGADGAVLSGYTAPTPAPPASSS
jgi:hypothetical protein